MRPLTALLARWRRDQSGTAAVEFGLIAGFVLAPMVLASLDLSGALKERMAIGHVLRAGAQVAMADPGASAVASAMAGAAEGFRLGATKDARTLHLTATRFCACPNAPAQHVGCTTVCTGNLAPYIGYRLRAEKDYAANLVPDMSFSDTLEVQIR